MISKLIRLSACIAILIGAGASADDQESATTQQTKTWPDITPSDLECVLVGSEDSQDKWRLKNQKSGAWIGDELSRGNCNRSRDSLRNGRPDHGNERPYICAAVKKSTHPHFPPAAGYNVFDPASGEPIVGASTFVSSGVPRWFEISYCEEALRSIRHDFVCVPHQGGSIAYNAREDYFMGRDAVFQNVYDCTITTFWATPVEICAFNGPYYFSIYHRSWGSDEPSRLGRFSSRKKCHEELR